MIELKVEKYCNDCPMFDAETYTDTYYENDEKHTNTVIHCKRRRQCRALIKYLEGTLKKNE